MDFSEKIKKQAAGIAKGILAHPETKPGVFVVGCSTSEIVGGKIGTCGSTETAEAVYEGLFVPLMGNGFSVTVQCCEHLNRALVTERELAEEKGWKIVSAVPHEKAGGSMASFYWRSLREPVLVERITADAGIDIGRTFIGMHLRDVAVPFRTEEEKLGEATFALAYTRPPYIGGERAKYF